MATLIGDGGHAADINETIEMTGWVKHHSGFTGGIYILGINDPQLRAKVASEIGVPDLPWKHPDAVIGPECSWGYGTHINYGVTMTRTKIGKHCTISPGVTICGDVTIGDRVLVGAGAIICDRVTIGDDVTIGAGSVVLPTTIIPNGVTVVGIVK